MPESLVELNDRWLISMPGKVTQCRLDDAFSLIITVEPTKAFEIRIEQPFIVSKGREDCTLDPEGDPVDIAPALHVLRRTIEQAIAFKTGSLELTFDHDLTLCVAEDEDYEAWSIVGPDGLMLVSTPGGGLAIWSGRA